MTPRYPLYIPSKGRWEKRWTARALDRMGIAYRVVIEPQESPDYHAVLPPGKILVLPFSNLGLGSIPARNWIWEHALSEGHARHWILDDNIARFYWFCENERRECSDATQFCQAERFTDKFTNVALAGFQYQAFMPRRNYTKRWDTPFALNTRIYSCILIENSLPFRWRGRYNEDTDLSLRVLKAGYCTILYSFCSQDKATTMTQKGGNTDELYQQTETFDGRWEMAKSLYLQHPDVVKITRKWGRWQHQVDYRPFKTNRLALKVEHGPPS